jgi:hypothetical protein
VLAYETSIGGKTNRIKRIFIKPTSDLAEKAVSKPIDFTLTPDTLNNIKDVRILLFF